MRLEDVTDYFRMAGQCENPFEVLRFRKRQRPGLDLEVRFRGLPPLRLRGGKNDFHVFHRIWLRDEYRLGSLPSHGLGSVVDVGANVGLFARRIAPIAGRVVAYEPAAENFSALQCNLTGTPNVIAVRSAVADRDGTLRLYRPSSEALSGSYSSFRASDGRLSAEFEQVDAITLERLFARHEIVTCDLLKIDVEGGEYPILYGASPGTLERVRRIHGEYHDVRPEDPSTRVDAFAGFLRDSGFTVETVPHRRKPNHGMFFARRSAPPVAGTGSR